MIPRVASACPICVSAELAPTDQTVDIAAVLGRWEHELGIRFDQNVVEAHFPSGNEPIRLERCPNCGFGRFAPPMPGSEAFYRAICGSEYYVEGKWEFEQAIGDLHYCRAKRILDVGCGSGNFLRLLRRADPGLRIWGHDQSAVLMRQLAAEGFEALPGAPEQLAANAGLEPFDAICMFQVLEHTADPLAFLRIYARLLRPGGTLIVTTPDADGPIRNFPEALTELPPHHLTQWTERTFRRCLPRFGFEITAVRNEPLPDYLWESYLPVQWEHGIWPAAVFDPAARRQGRESVSERIEFAVKGLRAVGVKRLHGVPSHTIYVRARLVDRNALASR